MNRGLQWHISLSIKWLIHVWGGLGYELLTGVDRGSQGKGKRCAEEMTDVHFQTKVTRWFIGGDWFSSGAIKPRRATFDLSLTFTKGKYGGKVRLISKVSLSKLYGPGPGVCSYQIPSNKTKIIVTREIFIFRFLLL